MKIVGGRIREQRLRLGLSLEDVAKRSSSSVNLIKELEWSMLDDIDFNKLLDIAVAVELKPSELLQDLSVKTDIDPHQSVGNAEQHNISSIPPSREQVSGIE